MSIEQRDFANFELGDDVLKLGGGVVQEMAAFAELELPKDDLAGALGRLVGVFGKDKVLRANATPQDLEITRAADWVEESGVMKPLRRSLWTPSVTPSGTTELIMTGAVANWQDRAADELVRLENTTGAVGYLTLLAGNRVMDTPTEKKNPNVQNFVTLNRGIYPTEADYMFDYVAPKLDKARIAGAGDPLHYYDTSSGDEIAKRYTDELASMDGLNGFWKYGFVRVASAGIQLAAQFRKASREFSSQFDADPNNPKIFVITDTFPVARTEEEIKKPESFQSPYTALRQLALTAKLLEEEAQASDLR